MALLTILLATIPLALVFTLSWYGVFTFVNSYVIKALLYTDKDWTSITLFFMAGTLFWQLACTEISARIGRRMTLVASMLVTAACFTAVGYARSIPALGGILFLMGFLSATYAVTWMSMVAESAGAAPGKAIALVQLVCVGIGIPTIIWGGAFTNSGNYRLCFLLCAASSTAGAAAFYFLTSGMANAVGPNTVSLLRIPKKEIFALVKGPFLWILALGICFEPFNFHAANQLFPNLARAMHALNEQGISVAVALGRLPALASLYLVSRFIDRSVPAQIYGAGLSAAALCIILMGFAGNVTSLVGFYLLFYVGHGVVWASNTATVNAAVDPRDRDCAFAILNIAMYVMILVTGALHYRLLSAGIPLSRVFIISGSIALCGGILLSLRARAINRSSKQAA